MLDDFLQQIYDEPVWFTVGMTAQLAFFFRFFFQWVVSERRRQSVVPVVFWHLSIAGGVLLLIYSIHRRDTVFTVGSLLGCFVYMRNLRLVRLEKIRGEGEPS